MPDADRLGATLRELLEHRASDGEAPAPDERARPLAPDRRARPLAPDERARPLAADGQTQAAVLVPICLLEGEPYVVLTRRNADLRRHAGEISFPGGRRDPQDATLLDTALREAEEEIGLAREGVQLAGALTPTSTFLTNYLIHPFVGAVVASSGWSVSPREVDAVIELPLRQLRDARTRTQLMRRGFTFETDAYVISEHLIWGATARILEDLLARLHPLLAGGG